MANTLEVRTLLATMRDIGSRAARPLLIYVFSIIAVDTVTDISGRPSALSLLSLIVSLVAGYLVLRAILLSTGLATEGKIAGFGSYFGMRLLQALGVLAGLILLIVPAIILIVRWSAAAPYLLCERSGAGEALAASFDKTKGNFWPIFATGLLGYLPILVGGAVVVAIVGFAKAFGVDGTADVLTSSITNGLGILANAYFILLSAAVYTLLFRPHEGLAEVFA